ncbi:hypothetical protein EIKCOROL_00670 [Eikenella corrodens ATCC 23834]|uniref:Uncharacterized protein n=1 Tax=Eikenella corrodens ATCC 23834 TaxID=546274 RepID=C0DTJ2_EIKCO|nr:hypothetical protein EIKCOROL_00670 [Eikenella corrodens ATCC 23834]
MPYNTSYLKNKISEKSRVGKAGKRLCWVKRFVQLPSRSNLSGLPRLRE